MYNFHTHTYRCKHAEGDVADYIKMARLRNMNELGFSDHTPLPDGWWRGVRMDIHELPDYVDAVRKGREDNPQMRILLGLECDCFPQYDSFYREIKEQYQMDYLAASIHAVPYGEDYINCYDETIKFNYQYLKAYAELFVKAMESGIFEFMAHPDLFCLRLDSWTPEALAISTYMLQAAKELQMPLEINCSGIRKSMDLGRQEIAFPKREFWELAGSFGIKVFVNSDAHTPERLTDNLDAGHYIRREYGLEEAVL